MLWGNTIPVMSLNDIGPGTFRDAIIAANANPGPDSIIFNVSGRISLLTWLPRLTDDSTYILGQTAPGGAQSVIIDGAAVPDSNGLKINGDYIHIEGLVVEGFSGTFVYGIAISGSDNVISNNLIRQCDEGIILWLFGVRNTIEYNTIAGINNRGINLMQCSDCSVIGNYIGTNAQSDTGLGGETGIYTTAAASDILIENNVISGNHDFGISLEGGSFEVYGNMIGTTVDGSDSLPNRIYGILVSSNDNKIGGAGPGQSGNVISGSVVNVWIAGDAVNNYVQSNVIGTTADGTVPLGRYRGVEIWQVDPPGGNNHIGGPNPEDGNLIAGHVHYGISIFNTVAIEVANNVIGLDSSGMWTIPNGHGIYAVAVDSLQIYGNVISGNDSIAVYLDTCRFSNIYDNIIGLSPDLGTAMGNDGSGVYIKSNSILNWIGPDNIIAYNNGAGITVTEASSRGNAISENLIYENTGLGIDLGDDGVTVNDPGDTDTGPNELLNYPVIYDLTINSEDPNVVEISGRACNYCTVEMFLAGDAVVDGDPSGYGEGLEFLQSALADDSGFFAFTGFNEYIGFTPLTFTATDDSNNTSEFSRNFSLPPGPLIVTAYSPVNLWITDPHGDYIGKDAAGVLHQTILPEECADYEEEPPDYIDVVTIHYPVPGEYTIGIIAEDGAPGGSTYSVGVQIDGSLTTVVVEDAATPATGSTDEYIYVVEENWHYRNGDANRDEILNILDITHLINYLYKSGPSPYPLWAGDANCNRVVNLLDITYLINYLYKGGEAPCDLSG
jgi:parallel beta-helix repeat protein